MRKQHFKILQSNNNTWSFAKIKLIKKCNLNFFAIEIRRQIFRHVHTHPNESHFLQIWDRLLSPEEILSISSCQSFIQGNVLSWQSARNLWNVSNVSQENNGDLRRDFCRMADMEKHLIVFPERTTVEMAQYTCRVHGGKLPVPKNAHENMVNKIFLISIPVDIIDNVYFGSIYTYYRKCYHRKSRHRSFLEIFDEWCLSQIFTKNTKINGLENFFDEALTTTIFSMVCKWALKTHI